MANHFFCGGIGIHTLEGSVDLRGGVTQLLQRGMGKGGMVILGGGCGDCGAGEVQLHAAAADLIFQLQNDPLSDLFADALCGGEHFLISSHNGEGKVLGSAGGQYRHGGLGTDTVDGGEQLIAALLFFGDKSVKIKGILTDGFGDIKPGILIQLQLAGGIGGDTAAVAYTIAVDDRKAGLQNRDGTGNIIQHGKPPY